MNDLKLWYKSIFMSKIMRFKDRNSLMPEIKDTGTVWIRGQRETVFAIKVDEKVLVPGLLEEDQSIEYWLEDKFLCVDVHGPDQKFRVARRFPLDLEATHPASPFGGFKKTKHIDMKVITFEDEGVQEKIFKNEEYVNGNIEDLDRDEFWRRAGFSS
jgi:hypothetical protein